MRNNRDLIFKMFPHNYQVYLNFKDTPHVSYILKN
jgi:hypothetical protein